MVFSDLFFIFVFLPAFIITYFVAYGIDKKCFSNASTGLGINSDFGTKPLVRNAVLVVFSLIFYAWGEPVYVLLMVISSFINYLVGRGIASNSQFAIHNSQFLGGEHKFSRMMLVVGIVINLLILGTFKYAGFFADTLTAIGIPVPNPHISLPIGISFYTFQSISYLIDVYRKEAPVQRRYPDLLLYISMFPQLIAGPIVRYDIVASEINSRRVTTNDFVVGSYRFFIGLGKKVILANQLSELSTQFLGGSLNHLTTTGAWVGIAAYTLQIFFDFSGYSDMAIGLGRCLGFHFAENFQHPYTSRTITEFWRKWHISLGSFFRDYVYIPLGGNRRHQALNILVVWFLTGMWHGASWNFILWGVYFGIIVMVEKYTILKVLKYIPRIVLHIYTILLFTLGWGIFYFDDFSKMLKFFNACFGGAAVFNNFESSTAIMNNFWLWAVALLFCMPVYDIVGGLFDRYVSDEKRSLKMGVAMVTRVVVSIILLASSVALLVGATNNAFIYTRF